MSDVISELITDIVKLYTAEMLGHIHILLAHDIEMSNEILKRRRQLDEEIRNLLIAKIGKEKQK